MKIPELVKNTRQILSNNSPVILTGLGVAGTIATAVLAVRATVTATRVIDREVEETAKRAKIERNVEPLTKKEKALLVWKLYIPAVATGAMTVTCIITSNRISNTRAAALASAYALSERAISEYKDKVVERIGEEEETKIRQELMQAHVNDTPFGPGAELMPDDGMQWIFDKFTGRYFRSTKQLIDEAANRINKRMLGDYSTTLSAFYEEIGLPTTSMSDHVGWNSSKLLELQWYPVEIFNRPGETCMAFDFTVMPTPNAFGFR